MHDLLGPSTPQQYCGVMLFHCVSDPSQSSRCPPWAGLVAARPSKVSGSCNAFMAITSISAVCLMNGVLGCVRWFVWQLPLISGAIPPQRPWLPWMKGSPDWSRCAFLAHQYVPKISENRIDVTTRCHSIYQWLGKPHEYKDKLLTSQLSQQLQIMTFPDFPQGLSLSEGQEIGSQLRSVKESISDIITTTTLKASTKNPPGTSWMKNCCQS